MSEFLRKLSSRKLWAAIAGVVTGIALIVGSDAETIEVIAGAVMSAASLVSYIITEGRIDEARINNAENQAAALDVAELDEEYEGYGDMCEILGFREGE